MADPTPYEQLQTAIREYGDAAMENFLRCRAFGRAVVEGFPDFLGCPAEYISLVPAEGMFDPSKVYGDDAFSFNTHGVIRLEPIAFGVCVTVPNAEDSGSLWLRTGLRVEVTGDSFDIFVAHQPMLRIPLEFTGHLTPVFETILKELMSVFRKEVARFSDERYAQGIGFVPSKSAS
ncbi:MAG: hypothetical protein AAF723_04445 [Pseudomonadota bacterium]